nr:hypothetical protein [Massilistercora timonensis]
MRKRENRIIGVGMLVLLLVLSSQTVWANSSWVWLTDRQPYQLLPAAAALTILLSFCLPYLFIWLEGREMGFRGFAEIIEKGPNYIVGTIYLILTVVAEVPVVCWGLRKEILDKKKGCLLAAVVNVLTTVMVAVIERILCYGQW